MANRNKVCTFCCKKILKIAGKTLDSFIFGILKLMLDARFLIFDSRCSKFFYRETLDILVHDFLDFENYRKWQIFHRLVRDKSFIFFRSIPKFVPFFNYKQTYLKPFFD